ncbi:MAG: class I SAM-dependent methyltransferase [Sedimentisphaerales bacterium]|nr:class I SAM-dependent methyltransferase [Sedimentisphaerales bacterium]
MADYISVNRAAYDALCEEYDLRASQKGPYEARVQVLAGTAIRYLKVRSPNPPVLEIGPGSGEALAYFESAGCRTVGVELSMKLACVSSKRSPHSSIVIANILDIEFVEGSFQVIYAGAVIHLFPLADALKVLRACHRWLAPEGVLFVSTTVHESTEEGFCTKTDYREPVLRFRRKWVEADFIDAVQESQFMVVERLYTDERDRGKKWVALICTKRSGTT